VTSRLSRVEVLRRISKSDTELIPRANVLLQQCASIDMSEVILKRAESYPSDITVKAADAIHLATAETFSSLIRGIITFDKQMAKNAERLGLKVFSDS
jgi:predicted nucleic acid-binding protein